MCNCVFCLSLLPLELGGADGPVAVESEPRLSHTPSLLENALSQENPGVGGGSSDGSISHAPWPAAPDITRETRNSLRDNGLGDWWEFPCTTTFNPYKHTHLNEGSYKILNLICKTSSSKTCIKVKLVTGLVSQAFNKCNNYFFTNDYRCSLFTKALTYKSIWVTWI